MSRFGLTASLGLVLSSPFAAPASANPPIAAIHVAKNAQMQNPISMPSGSTEAVNTVAQGAAPSGATLTRTPLTSSTGKVHAVRHHGKHQHTLHHGTVRRKTVRHHEAGASGDPRMRVIAANHAARVQPDSQAFNNAIQQYPYSDGALYQLYAAPGEITDIALQEGEQLAGTGPVAAGDTVRWIIGDTISGTGATTRVHILVKPTRADLVTNLVINTDRRTYHLELHGTSSTYMASLSWTYSQDQLIAIRRATAAAARAAPIAAGIDLDALNFGYTISGDKPSWRPLRAFDDGTHVYIDFPDAIAQGDMPPLFVLGDKGQAELVNYRVSGHHLIVDRLFAAAELRLGDKHATQTVKISHINPKVR
jgi:type IV secretion system protein VirB9